MKEGNQDQNFFLLNGVCQLRVWGDYESKTEVRRSWELQPVVMEETK